MITDMPNMRMEALIKRAVTDPSSRKVLAEKYTIAAVPPVQKTRFRMRRR